MAYNARYSYKQHTYHASALQAHFGGFFFLRGKSMKYNKEPLSFKEQAELLISRGLHADSNTLIKCLESVNYYRLSAYWYIFLQDDNTFTEGASFEIVWQRYRFDRRLRIHIMDVIERVEVAIRSQLTNLFAQKNGAFAYLENACLPNLSQKNHRIFLGKLNNEIKRSDYSNNHTG